MTGPIDIVVDTADALAEYGRVSIAFAVDRVLDVERNARCEGEFLLRERALETPMLKNYDASPGNSPHDWSRYFDVSNWGFVSAVVDG